VCRIFICTTCNRYAPQRSDETSPGLRLAQTVKAAAAQDKTIAVRMVECLNTCPNPCAAALREPGKAVIRFGGLKPEDTSALLAAATAYAQSADGILSPNALPERLRSKLAGCITLGVPELARR
jgi:predicted metal-binding protein